MNISGMLCLPDNGSSSTLIASDMVGSYCSHSYKVMGTQILSYYGAQRDQGVPGGQRDERAGGGGDDSNQTW